jgi:hypothetical protein
VKYGLPATAVPYGPELVLVIEHLAPKLGMSEGFMMMGSTWQLGKLSFQIPGRLISRDSDLVPVVGPMML